METDASQEVETVELIEFQSEDENEKRPIMLLLKRLIRNKQSTVMTNTQIVEILKKEFDIDVDACHEIEVDIYIKIIKKYLKDWPQWEELERISTKLSSANDFDAVAKVLDHKYKNLKEYLGVMLEACKPFAKQSVAEIEVDYSKDDSLETKDIVMEVYSTRRQLTQLIFRKPRVDLNNTIFNIKKIEPTRITLNTLSFESILNFWWTKIYINLPNFSFFRELMYIYNHSIVNKTRRVQTEPETLDTRVYNRGKKTKDYNKTLIYKYLDTVLDLCKDEHITQLLQVIFHILRKDMEEVPDIIKVPSCYRKYANRYKYVRYLYVENDVSDGKYDLQLQEVMTPTFKFFFGRLGLSPETSLGPIQEWLRIECNLCKATFPGSTEMMSVLQNHFNNCHHNEQDWQCPNCQRLFSMDYLSKHRWCHEC